MSPPVACVWWTSACHLSHRTPVDRACVRPLLPVVAHRHAPFLPGVHPDKVGSKGEYSIACGLAASGSARFRVRVPPLPDSRPVLPSPSDWTLTAVPSLLGERLRIRPVSHFGQETKGSVRIGFQSMSW